MFSDVKYYNNYNIKNIVDNILSQNMHLTVSKKDNLSKF